MLITIYFINPLGLINYIVIVVIVIVCFVWFGFSKQNCRFDLITKSELLLLLHSYDITNGVIPRHHPNVTVKSQSVTGR